MNSLYRNTLYSSSEERLLDRLIAKLNVDRSVRYSLTEGGKLMPFTHEEKQRMREAQAQAISRLAIEKAMQTQNTLVPGLAFSQLKLPK